MLERISYSKGFPKECGSSQRTELATAADDLISRQAAIDGKISIQRADGVEIYSDEAVPVEYLKRLSSAQPEQPSEIQDILDYLDTALHPIISPEHWSVYSELYDMISTLPLAQQWIPCSKRLPKKSGDYLVTVAHHSGELWVEVDQFDNENGSWWHYMDDVTAWMHYMDDVTAWMPRPKPYKGEES